MFNFFDNHCHTFYFVWLFLIGVIFSFLFLFVVSAYCTNCSSSKVKKNR